MACRKKKDDEVTEGGVMKCGREVRRGQGRLREAGKRPADEAPQHSRKRVPAIPTARREKEQNASNKVEKRLSPRPPPSLLDSTFGYQRHRLFAAATSLQAHQKGEAPYTHVPQVSTNTSTCTHQRAGIWRFLSAWSVTGAHSASYRPLLDHLLILLLILFSSWLGHRSHHHLNSLL